MIEEQFGVPYAPLGPRSSNMILQKKLPWTPPPPPLKGIFWGCDNKFFDKISNLTIFCILKKSGKHSSGNQKPTKLNVFLFTTIT